MLGFASSQQRDSNPRPTDYKSVALPTELCWQKVKDKQSQAVRQKRTLLHSSFPAIFKRTANVENKRMSTSGL